MELTKKLTLTNKEVDVLARLLGEMPSGVIRQLVEDGKLTSEEAGMVSDIYALIEQ